MAQVMEFDADFTQKLVQIYSTPDVIAQRDRVLSLINLQEGEHVLDIGSGPGLSTYAIADIVGQSGRVVGIDISDMALNIARKQCADQSWVTFQKADAVELPFEDNEFDVVVSAQVYEYIEDIDTALAELNRVLRPGGRAVILDSDWDSCVWHTQDRERMHRIIDLWNTHCSRPFLPRTLIGRLIHVGFDVVHRDIFVLFNPEYDPNTYSYGVIDFISSYIKGIDPVYHEDVNDWARELHDLGNSGDYFFSMNRYIFVVNKPV